MVPYMRLANVWLFLAVTGVTALGGCTPWPGPASGGWAERFATDWVALRELQDRYHSAQRSGGDRFAAGQMVEAHLLIIRAQREHEGGLGEDSNLTLAQADRVMTKIEHELRAKRASLHGPPGN